MHHVAAFYRFADLHDPARLRTDLARLGCKLGIRGSVLVAAEGVNGTVSGTAEALARFLDLLRSEPGCADLTPQWSTAPRQPFGRLKVRLKREIVTMGAPAVRPVDGVGTYVSPRDWNALIATPDVALIDTRNAFEVALGTFEGAEDPGLERFGEFPDWWSAARGRLAGKRVAMFCTGGIRCEKATALALAGGAREVFHLRGGILAYLAETRPQESRWRGECFVFDERVALVHGLEQGRAVLCRGCRHPVTPEERAAPGWEDGVSCPRCVATAGPDALARRRERQRQMALAKARGAGELA